MHSQIEEFGFARVPGINSIPRLVRLAKTLGNTASSTNNNVVERIFPRPQLEARPNSFGSVHGTGAYPLHSDTAHWPIPTRFLVLRVVGDVRRNTTICDALAVYDSFDAEQRALVRDSVWYSNFGDACFTCSMLFRHCGKQVFRFDPQCMRPANEPAQQVTEWISEALASRREKLTWENDCAIVVDNWRMVHGRGDQPTNELTRELQRIYVKL